MACIDINLSPKITVGSVSQVQWEAVQPEFGGRALILTDAALEQEAVSLQQQLDSRGMNTILFARDNLSCNSETLDEVLSLARGSRSKMLVSLGGEGVMALGRLTASAAPSRLHASDLLENPLEALADVQSGPYLVEIPFGGSHALMFCRQAPLASRETGRVSMVHWPEPASYRVVLDESLMREKGSGAAHLPAALRLSTAVEAFLWPGSSRFTEVHAAGAVREAVSLLRIIREDSETPEYRSRECSSLLLSAFAAAFGGCGPAQALAWAVSFAGKLPYLAVNALLLPWVLDSPIYEASARAAALNELLSDEDFPCSSPAEGVRAFWGHLELPARLRDLGGDLDTILPAALTAAEMDGHVRSDFNEAAFRDILKDDTRRRKCLRLVRDMERGCAEHRLPDAVYLKGLCALIASDPQWPEPVRKAAGETAREATREGGADRGAREGAAGRGIRGAAADSGTLMEQGAPEPARKATADSGAREGAVDRGAREAAAGRGALMEQGAPEPAREASADSGEAAPKPERAGTCHGRKSGGGMG